MGQNRCHTCSHFATLKQDEPQILSYDYDPESNRIRVEVRISLSTECCNADAKEYRFSIEGTPRDEDKAPLDPIDLRGHFTGQRHDLKIKTIKAENIENVIAGRAARYTQTFYGVKIEGVIACKCHRFNFPFEASEKIKASQMEKIAL